MSLVVDCQCVNMFSLLLILLLGVRIDCLIENQKIVQWTLTNKNGCKFVAGLYTLNLPLIDVDIFKNERGSSVSKRLPNLFKAMILGFRF